MHEHDSDADICIHPSNVRLRECKFFPSVCEVCVYVDALSLYWCRGGVSGGWICLRCAANDIKPPSLDETSRTVKARAFDMEFE